MTFNLKDITNSSLAIANTLNLGTFNLSGRTTNISDTSLEYTLKSKYKNINTARVNTQTGSGPPIWICPPASGFGSASLSEYSSTDIENISILGIIFLNNGSISSYNTFEFMSAGTAYGFTCAQSTNSYNEINYTSIPFYLEP